MSDAILAAMIAAAAGVISNFILSRKQASEIDHKMEVRQAVTDTKIEELTREVREHNNFARRMPVVEEKIAMHGKTIEELRHYHME